jgi:hypothetical protein
MGDPKDRDAYLALLAKQDWGQLMVDLVGKKAPIKHLGKDLTQEIAARAIARVCDPDRSPWDPSRGASLFTHLSWVFKSELAHYREAVERQETDTAGDDLPEPTPDSDADPEVRTTREADRRALRDELVAALDKRPLAKQILLLEADEGISTVEEQVERTGRTRAQVYEARRHVVAAARALAEERARRKGVSVPSQATNPEPKVSE